MKKIKLTITGCMGRMGTQLIKSSNLNKDFKVVSITENKIINRKIKGIYPSLNSINSFKKSHVIIDFTVPKCTMEVLKIASKLKKKVIIGTTGFSKNQERLIKHYSKIIPILKAGNMSLGINLLMYLTEITSKSLGNKFKSKIFEVHHKHKLDYPSGTALMLGNGIAFGKNKSLSKTFCEGQHPAGDHRPGGLPVAAPDHPRAGGPALDHSAAATRHTRLTR